MIVRSFKESDLNELKMIHDKYFKDEFTFEDFCRNASCALICEENGRIISAMNLRSLLEMVSISDKEFPTDIRRDAMVNLLSKSLLIAGQAGFDSIHAFVQDDNWANHLKKRYGFRDSVGKSLVIG
jgi:hypothetical protein